MEKYIIIFTLILISLIALTLTKSKFEEIDKVDKFDKESFINSIKQKNILICSNSNDFNEHFDRVKNVNNTFIIRFNSILHYLPSNEKTDVLFVTQEVVDENTIETFNLWKSKCKVYLINEIIKDNKILNDLSLKLPPGKQYTSGFITFIYCLAYNTKIILVGFELPDDYNTKANWFREVAVWEGHDVNFEKKILLNLHKKFNIIKY